ncbi:hypothetical protein ACNPQM_19815 [Streptomyces sp. NPDC056231]|uniref:hypothetical protein n=1 Tax=Streptomyces sp. NPDC056231 TaxID=3345755 RepID=UPI003AAEC85C
MAQAKITLFLNGQDRPGRRCATSTAVPASLGQRFLDRSGHFSVADAMCGKGRQGARGGGGENPAAADMRQRRATALYGWWHAGPKGRHAGVRRCTLGQ